MTTVLEPTTPTIPDAGRCCDLGKNASYDEARRGVWPLVGTDGKRSVPTAFIRQKLGLPPVSGV